MGSEIKAPAVLGVQGQVEDQVQGFNIQNKFHRNNQHLYNGEKV